MGILDAFRKALAEPGLPSVYDRAVPAATQLAAPAPEQKLYSYPYGYPAIALPYGMLVHGPGASDLLAGDQGLSGNSAVFACLMALSMAFFEAPMRVGQYNADGERTWLPTHPMQPLLDAPNPAMNQQELWFWVCWALHANGNAYLQKIRSGNATTGNVVELWPRSPRVIEVKTERKSDFISYYKRDLGDGQFENIPTENMVHLRLGIEERDHRVGCAPLRRLLRQIASDEQAAAFEDRLLRNFAVPGTVVTTPPETELTQEQADTIKERIHQAFSGERQGYTGVLTGGAKLERMSFSPNEMALEAIHKYLESRICAVLGVPPAVVGLMVGLEQTSNYASARVLFEAFTERTLIPRWSLVSAKINQQLTLDFTSDRSVKAEFDLADVRSLQEDETALYTRISLAVKEKWMTVNEARGAVNLKPIDGGDEITAAAPTSPPPGQEASEDEEPPEDADDEARARYRGLKTVELVLPAGSGEPLEILPLAPEMTDARLRRLARLWDAEMGPEWAGMLDADVVHG